MDLDQAVAATRAFNRAHTRFAGVLRPRYMGSDLNVTEARMLYEIAQRAPVLAADLQIELDLDAGYASRILKRFEERGWVVRERGRDARQRPVSLTPAGQQAFARLDADTHADTAQRLQALGPARRAALVGALDTARRALVAPEPRWTLRTFRPGDMGLVTARQSILYNQGYGWGAPMEMLLGEVTAGFLRNFQPGREQCWIAELDGRMAGSIFCVDGGDGRAQLRLLYVEPEARGLGIGEALVRTCVAFAREAGYSGVRLWTHTILESARRIYAAQGFAITAVATHEEFGDPVQGETWELSFDQGAAPATPLDGQAPSR